ncbi:MAG: hypothetical protein IE909_01975 [Campylobacterales bacterium]|nr:hypothetical protein [Campylobacterales bacterium]
MFDRLYSLIDKKEHYVYLSHNSSLQIDSLYNSVVANNETYKEFSRNSLGIVQEKSQFKRFIYDDQQLLNDFWSS